MILLKTIEEGMMITMTVIEAPSFILGALDPSLPYYYYYYYYYYFYYFYYP